MRGRGSRGASSVEMALLTPLLVLLFMGVVEIGRMLFFGIVVEEAAQEGALFGAYRADQPAQVRTRVVESVPDHGFTVTVACPSGASGGPAVTVAMRLDLLSPFGLWGDSVVLERTVTGENLTDRPCVAG